MNKKLLIFSAKWCAPCLALSAQLAAINIPFDTQYIDIDKEKDMATKYNIAAIPTLIIIDEPSGGELRKLVGVRPSKELEQFLNG